MRLMSEQDGPPVQGMAEVGGTAPSQGAEVTEAIWSPLQTGLPRLGRGHVNSAMGAPVAHWTRSSTWELWDLCWVRTLTRCVICSQLRMGLNLSEPQRHNGDSTEGWQSSPAF